MERGAPEFYPVVDPGLFQQLCFTGDTFEAVDDTAALPKGPFLEPKMQTGVHARRAFKTGGHVL